MTSNYTESEQNWLEQFTTKHRWFFGKMIDQRKKEDGEIVLPPGVMTDRRNADLLRMLEKIDKNTEDVPWLSKFVGNLFKFGGSQAEQKYPSKGKK
jgi:hypothetical protein